MISTMPSKHSEGVKVRGACPKGHVTQTTSPPGRVTWRGECSDPKCRERVICRRVPTEPPAPGEPAAGEPEQSAPNTARKVSWNAQVPKHKQGGDGDQPPADPRGSTGAGDDGEHGYRRDGEPVTGPGQQAAESTLPGAPEQPRPSNGQPRSGRGRLAESLRSRRTARAARERPEYRTEFPFQR